MKVRCICGNLMHDENLETCDVYGSFLEENYCELMSKELKSVNEFVDKIPMEAPFWKCKQCERLLFFKRGKLQIYKLEEEILD